jgi:DNA polymerase-3 subunit delta'
MNLWYRDVLVMKATDGNGRPVFREEEPELKRQAANYSYARIEECINAIDLTRQRMSANVNLEVSLEMLLL